MTPGEAAVMNASAGLTEASAALKLSTSFCTAPRSFQSIGPLQAGGLRVIEEGLKADDRIVTAGLLRAIPGQKVDPQLKKIEAQSVSAK